MSIYNYIHVQMCCPRCGNVGNMEVETYIGLTDLLIYHIGDKYVWHDRKAVQNGGRPENGDLTGEGYVGECPICHKDFFVKIIVEDDQIKSVEPDLSREPFINS